MSDARLRAGGPPARRPHRTFFEDATAPRAERRAVDAFRWGWERQVGQPFPAPTVTSGRDFRISVRATKVHDSLLADVNSEALVASADDFEGSAIMHVVAAGAWSFTRQRDCGATDVRAGQFSLRRGGVPTVEVAPKATAKVLVLPESSLRPLVGDRLIIGPAASAEMRLLMAHVRLLEATARDLAPQGAEAGQAALIELVRGATTRRLDAAEPRLAPALAGAARDLVEARLADADLSASMLARELHVSVRTLNRAFAKTEESVTGYIRRRRLEQAWRELTAHVAGAPPTVADLAAHWHFADSSHLIRAFKKRYGETPGEVSRSHGRRPTMGIEGGVAGG